MCPTYWHKSTASEYTGTIVVNDTIKDIKVDGTDKYAAGLTAVFGAKLSEKEIQYIEKKLNLLEVNSTWIILLSATPPKNKNTHI